MTNIEVKGFNGIEYVVHAIPWILKNDLRMDCTELNALTGEGKFDRKKFIRGMVKLCVTIADKPFTDEDFLKLDGKTGDAVDIAVFRLNDLTKVERLNLFQPLETTA
jgi:hypothetical protein